MGNSILRLEWRGGLAGGVASGEGSEKSKDEDASRGRVTLNTRPLRDDPLRSERRVVGVTGDRGGAPYLFEWS